MRLTLRTLLAYLDDILEPSQTKEIGNKLAESEFASDLVERIREVMRRRRLSAPEVLAQNGGLDANLVAEYLDNMLTPEAVSEIEKQCLESDVNLAEAASCHQILTLVLGEPVEISPESRRRMYGLVSQGSGDEKAAVAAGKSETAERSSDAEIKVAAAAHPEDETETISSELPDYLKPRPFLRRALVILIPVLLILVFTILTDTGANWVGWVFARWFGSAAPAPAVAMQDIQVRPPQHHDLSPEAAGTKAKTEPKKAEDKAGPAIANAVDDAKTREGTKVAQTTETSRKAQAAEIPSAERKPSPPEHPTPESSPTAPIPTKPVVGETDTKREPKAPKQVAVLPPGSSAPAPPTPDSGANPKVEATHESAPPAEPAPDVRLVSKSGVLLGYDSARDDWFVLERPGLTLPKPGNPESGEANTGDLAPAGGAGKVRVPSPPSPMSNQRRTDQLAEPEPFDSLLEFGDGLCNVWMLGGTSVRLLAPRGGTRFGIEIGEGRLVIRSGSPKDGTPYKPLVIGISVLDEQWQLELLRPETQCGIEIVPSFPEKPGEDAKECGYRGALYVVQGDVRFVEAVGRQRTLSAGRWISLAPADRSVATTLKGSPLRVKGVAIPAWLNPEARRNVSAMQAKVAADFEKEFIPDQPVSLSIGPVAKNNRPKVSELAVKTLALTNQYQELVQVLAQVPREESVQTAAAGLRSWLTRGTDHSELLEEELQTVFIPEDQKIVLRLLWGYNNSDARDLATSNQLVEWLDHDKLAVRTLAFDHVRELAGQTKNYRPTMPSGERKRIKKEWESYVERTRGLSRH